MRSRLTILTILMLLPQKASAETEQSGWSGRFELPLLAIGRQTTHQNGKDTTTTAMDAGSTADSNLLLRNKSYTIGLQPFATVPKVFAGVAVLPHTYLSLLAGAADFQADQQEVTGTRVAGLHSYGLYRVDGLLWIPSLVVTRMLRDTPENPEAGTPESKVRTWTAALQLKAAYAVDPKLQLRSAIKHILTSAETATGDDRKSSRSDGWTFYPAMIALTF